MLQISLIGNLGGNAEVKSSNGKEFVAFRVAHTDKWTDEAGQVHESTTWIDCVLSEKGKIFEYLKKGTQVFIQGSVRLRVYSSEKDRCMKAGMQVNVNRIELIGTKPDEIPQTLFTKNGESSYKVSKYYHIAEFVNDAAPATKTELRSRSGEEFVVDGSGWVSKVNREEE